MCGGTRAGFALTVAHQGLSPRVRGNHHEDLTDRERTRSIPACAGEPHANARIAHLVMVYPRVCGGTNAGLAHPPPPEGLSPRVRGNRCFERPPRPSKRSIPACAGEPPLRRLIASAMRVYPRVCGGTTSKPAGTVRFGGLSPRVRGNPPPCGGAVVGGGSIPACAGEPRAIPTTDVPSRVYPRVCGGTRRVCRNAKPGCGLSPRVRGNPATRPCQVPGMRSIPACAGEPQAADQSAGQPTVYPRVCGGTCTRSVAQMGIEGLSPRVRGNPVQLRRRQNGGRSIPACAGEPCASAITPSA